MERGMSGEGEWTQKDYLIFTVWGMNAFIGVVCIHTYTFIIFSLCLCDPLSSSPSPLALSMYCGSNQGQQISITAPEQSTEYLCKEMIRDCSVSYTCLHIGVMDSGLLPAKMVRTSGYYLSTGPRTLAKGCFDGSDDVCIHVWLYILRAGWMLNGWLDC